MSNSDNYIQSVSYAKLAEYDQTRTDLPIRKYVLIANLLREEKQQQKQQNQDQDSSMTNDEDNQDKDEDMLVLEQQWFETCLNELDKEDDDFDQEEDDDENNEQNGQYNPVDQNDKLISINQKIYNMTQQHIHVHAIYDTHSRRGILLCTSTI